MDMNPIKIIVQINGKKVEDFWATNEINPNAFERFERIACNIPAVKKELKNKTITKITVTPKIVNIYVEEK